MIKMKEKKQIMKKASCYSTQCDSFDDELMETEQTDRELYLFMRGGFGAK
ncbi:hypothetical protein [Candidatus Methanoperedens nitratireducens]|uniref:Uncharacterized protein n=1 Tax=Candidatus Methanoperedens nitratireducens TaxID=1392998 RepID=A0A284VJA6_9EURY|nr:hypothetical protein [Candidatus Methanoperedens nitroreducens]SNQ59333.1 hypothetical protein MNV_1140029 [Candidatus Methanoperedens nitroreducens]